VNLANNHFGCVQKLNRKPAMGNNEAANHGRIL
jgi:hypothetical protein